MIKIATTDQKRRIVLPYAKPGEVYAVRQLAGGKLELSLMAPAAGKKHSKPEIENLLKSCALTPRLSWEDLRRTTRES